MKEQKHNEMSKYDRVEAEATRDEPVYVPSTDIYEREDAILVRCDMPGVADDQLEVTLENYELSITGRQDAVRFAERYNALSTEYGTGMMKRTFKVPQQIDRDRIKASLHNGVLHIELPKAEQAQPRKIEVKTGQ